MCIAAFVELEVAVAARLARGTGEDRRGLWAGLQLAGQLEPVAVGKPAVEHYQRRVDLLDGPLGLGERARGEDLVAGAREKAFEQLDAELVVVDDQDPRRL